MMLGQKRPAWFSWDTHSAESQPSYKSTKYPETATLQRPHVVLWATAPAEFPANSQHQPTAMYVQSWTSSQWYP